MGKITTTTVNNKTGKKSVKVTHTRPRVSPSVKKAIKRAVNSNIETKIAVKQVWQQNVVLGAGLDAASGLGLTTTGISTAPSTILPSLTQNASDAGRVGNLVKVKKLVLKYSLRALDTTGAPGSAGTNPFKGKPMYARVIVYNKRYAIDDYANAGILDKGVGVGNLDSSPDSWLEPYNRKDFRILYSKQFKLCAFADSGSATLENMPNGFSNFVMRKATIKIPKKLYFAKDADTDPQNCSPKMAVCICNVDGTVVTNVQYRLQVNTEAQLYYTDA